MITWNKNARRQGALIVEIGAGDGRQAATTARLGYRVISIDASKSNLALGRSIYDQYNTNDTKPNANGFPTGTFTQIHSAVSNYNGTAKFFAMSGMGRLLDGDKGSVTNAENPKWSQQVQVPVNRLDDLVQERPWILKIDVEGHELAVLQGAKNLLALKPRIIILEFNPVMMDWSAHTDAVDVLLLLHDLGYELYDGQISEPRRKGFVAKYGSMNRPTDFRQLVDWFKQSKEFDWWGSWTDILAILPPTWPTTL